MKERERKSFTRSEVEGSGPEAFFQISDFFSGFPQLFRRLPRFRVHFFNHVGELLGGKRPRKRDTGRVRKETNQRERQTQDRGKPAKESKEEKGREMKETDKKKKELFFLQE